MRALLVIVVLALLVPFSARAADVEFVRVWPAWRDASAFESISEYFTGREEHGHRVVRRTTPDARAGFYYLVRVKNSDSAKTAAKFSLQVITPLSPATKTYSFAVDLPSGQTVFQLGLTGPDWPNAKTHPVAWKLELLSADGSLLATAKSFLWEMPSR